MHDSLAEQGFLSVGEIQGTDAALARAEYRPVAILECVQEIPCNPCEDACPYKAIRVGTPITAKPSLDIEKCVGCGACIAKCPGLAIFVIGIEGSEANISLPYEYWPLPQAGEEVYALNRQGEMLAVARVSAVKSMSANDQTAVVTVTISREYVKEVRSIGLIREE